MPSDATRCRSDAKRSQAMPSYAKRCQAMPSDAKRCEAMRCDAMRCEAMRYDAKRCDAMRSDVKRCDAKRCDAKRCEAMRGDAKRCEAMRSDAKRCEAMRGDAKRCEAMRSDARRCEAMRGDAKRCEAMRSDARRCEAMRGDAKRCERCEAMRSDAKRKMASNNPDYKSATSIHEFTVKKIKGEEVKLDVYKGHVCIIVNVASQCGLTANNYKQLNELYEQYAESKGLRILAFPCNQFAGQEPGNPEEIVCFAADRKVKFDLFEKVDVNGDDASPLWKFLKHKQGGALGNFIKWNFTKFIIDKNGVRLNATDLMLILSTS
ncbi:hypothetical protein MSG28_009593 [Choristoneura fumiferana]|uniref:Uncharacterized protein n=1 Tax=Choristoneura fumiferana TaxID=7141 RepID=A0ACC0JBP6_CHOFU|nr:hypothetical protein MSG28_009593 [Choristoneura fumiferana]